VSDAPELISEVEEGVAELAERERRALAEVPIPVHAEARAKVVSARANLGGELDELVAATRSALDIPAKVRRNPVRTAALAGGGLFMVLGGPRRVARGVAGRVRRRPAPQPLLPDEVVRVIESLGVSDQQARGALERGFADYLQGKPKTVRRGPAQSFWRFVDNISFFVAPAMGKQIADRLFAADPGRRARSRDAGSQAPGDADPAAPK